tara:strand:- start:7607 stop:8104 length:498 start_codon:yes stop_codon:yes gene_type:complete
MGNLNFGIKQPEQMQESSQDKPLIPAGTYKAVIFDSGQKANTKGTGEFLWLGFEILEGPQSGKDFSMIYNIRHNNEMAEKIAVEELSRLCHAINLRGTADNEEDILHNELMIDVVIETGKDGKVRNKITKYKPLPQATEQATEQATSSAPAPAVNSKKPFPHQAL